MALQVISEPTTFTGGLSANNFPISVGGGVTTSSTAPSSPSAGSLWFNTENGLVYVYYVDANSQQWVAPDNSGGGNGKIAQVVVASTNIAFTTTSTIPQDNTIPQSTEGAEFMTINITPTNAASTIEVSFVGTGTADGGKNIVLSLFEGSASNAFAADFFYVAIANGMTSMPLLGRISAGSTTSRTYRLRIGMSAATPGTARMISDTGGSYFGGVRNCTLQATEILP